MTMIPLNDRVRARLVSAAIAHFVWLGVWLAPAHGQPPAAPHAPRSKISDAGGLFSSEAMTAAQAELERIEKTSHVPTLISTVASLHGQKPGEVVERRASAAGFDALLVLLSKQERHLELLVSPGLRPMLPRSELQTVRDAMIRGLGAGRPDDALRDGVRAISAALASTKGGDSGLVIRNQVKLTLAGARKVVAGAEAKAAAMNLKVNIAVVDDGGHMLCFARMDGARPASGYTAMTKATTAATFRQETGPLPKGTTSPDPLLNLSLQNAAAASGGKLTTLYGGIPVIIDGQVVGAVGVGGGSGEQDSEVARAGVAAFQSALEGERVSPRPPTTGVTKPAEF